MLFDGTVVVSGRLFLVLVNTITGANFLNANSSYDVWRDLCVSQGCRRRLGEFREWSHCPVGGAVPEIWSGDAGASETGNGFQGPSTRRRRAPIATTLGQEVVLGFFSTIDVRKFRLSEPKVLMRLTPV